MKFLKILKSALAGAVMVSFLGFIFYLEYCPIVYRLNEQQFSAKLKSNNGDDVYSVVLYNDGMMRCLVNNDDEVYMIAEGRVSNEAWKRIIGPIFWNPEGWIGIRMALDCDMVLNQEVVLTRYYINGGGYKSGDHLKVIREVLKFNRDSMLSGDKIFCRSEWSKKRWERIGHDLDALDKLSKRPVR